MFWLVVLFTSISLSLLISQLLVTKKDTPIILWPEYFDSSISKSHGRRVPRKLAANSPTVEQIAKAAKRLKLNPKIEIKKAYPSRWWKRSGRVLVQAKTKKTKIIRQIAIVMKKYK